jgi:hypothetical protein
VSGLGRSEKDTPAVFLPEEIRRKRAQLWAQLAQEPLSVRKEVEHRLLNEGLLNEGSEFEIPAAALGGLSPLAPEQLKMGLDCPKMGNSCLFLASQFGQNSEATFEESKKSIGDITTINDIVRFIPTSKLKSEVESECGSPVKGELCLIVSGRLNHNLRQTAIQNGEQATQTKPAQQAIEIGKEMLSRSRTTGTCLYDGSFVRADDIPTALGALEYPACVPKNGEDIQKAIVDVTSHIPAGDVDRWTFAREWIAPNASKYGYDPERFNTRSYFIRCEMRRLLTIRLPSQHASSNHN